MTSHNSISFQVAMVTRPYLIKMHEMLVLWTLGPVVQSSSRTRAICFPLLTGPEVSTKCATSFPTVARSLYLAYESVVVYKGKDLMWLQEDPCMNVKGSAQH